MDAEYENFMQKVEEISSIVHNLNSKNPEVVEKAQKRADLYLQGIDETKDFSEDGLHIKTNKTVINKNTFKDEALDGSTASCNAFMAYVEKDAAKRYEDKRQRKEISDQYKRDGNKAFREKDFEKAFDLYNKAIDQIKDSCVLYTNRAITCLNLGLYKRALSDCEWALKVNNNSLKAWLYKARAHHNLGEQELAQQCLREAEITNPDYKQDIKEYHDQWFKETEQ